MLSLEKMTPSYTSEYAWNPQITVFLAGRSPNLCLITDKLSPETVEQDDQKLRYYVNSMIGLLSQGAKTLKFENTWTRLLYLF